MYALNTRLTVEDWDYIAQEAYRAFRIGAPAIPKPDWQDLDEDHRRAWGRAIERGVTVAIGELPKPEHVIE